MELKQIKMLTRREQFRRQLRDKAIKEGGLHNKVIAKYQDSRAKMDDRMVSRRERQANKHMNKAIKYDTRRREGKARLEMAKANIRNSKAGIVVRQVRENTRVDYKPNNYRNVKRAEIQAKRAIRKERNEEFKRRYNDYKNYTKLFK